MDDVELASPATVYRSPARRQCEERTVVLLAMGIESELLELQDEYALAVHPRDAERAKQQLALYALENRVQPSRAASLPALANGLHGALLYVAVLVIVDRLQSANVYALDWWEAGKLHADLIRNGEWWRSLTALSLHTDLVHLVSNLGFGILFGMLVSQLFGVGLAWCLIVLAGGLGNMVNAFVQSPQHTAVGASTAVFAALGIVVVHTWRQQAPKQQRWLRRWAAPISGVVLLSFLGLSGERTDFMAHILGFAMGALLGYLASTVQERVVFDVHHQYAFGAAALGMIVVAWVLAL